MFLGDEQLEAYSTPQLSPLYPQGPYEYPDVRALLVTYELDRELARDLVPAPLGLRESPTCVLGVYEYGHVNGFGGYEEFLVGIAASHEGDPVTYTPYCILDGDAPLAAGREIWGLPKKTGEVSLDTDGAVATGRVARGGVDLATVTVETTDPTDRHPFAGSTLRNVHWKRIPSAAADEQPAVNRLVTSLTHDIDVEWAHRGSGDVELSRSAADPVAVFEPAGEVSGYLLECSWVLERATDPVIHRFEERR
jgi:acetoacetate decarboxylase